MRRKIIVIIVIVITIILGIIIFFVNKNKTLEITYPLDDLIERQAQTDDLIRASLSENYTLNNPQVIVNPYEISPLTALVIFNTEDDISYDIYVNNNFLYTTTKTREHLIPIYLLNANYTNRVHLVGSDDSSKNLEITTELSEEVTTKLDVLKTDSDPRKLYFTSSSTSALLYAAFNSTGELVWQLNIASQGSIEPLQDGTFLVGVEEYISDKVSNFTGIYRIDYMGKIISRFDSKYMYHHDMQALSDGTALIAGDSMDKNKSHMSLVYRLDLDTGNIIDFIDIDDVFTSLSEDYSEYRLSLPWGMGINSIYYDEETKNLVISFRCMNMVMSINYDTHKINWIYSNHEDTPEFLHPYLLTPTADTPMPYGQHEARMIDNNTLTIYNNDFDEKNNTEEYLSYFSTNQASALVLDINTDDMTISKVDSIEEPSQKFSYALGGFKKYDDYQLVTFSYLFTDSAINNNESIYEFIDNTYSNIVLYDSDKNVIFDADISDRLFRTSLEYLPDEISNYSLKNYTYFNNEDKSVLIDSEELSKNAKDYPNIVKFYQNSVVVDLDPESYQELSIVLIGEENYVIPYLKGRTYYDINPGKYDVYLIIDNVSYRVDLCILFT